MSKRYFIRKKNVDIVSETFDASKDSDVVLEETMVYTSNRVRGVTKPTSIKNVAQLNEMARYRYRAMTLRVADFGEDNEPIRFVPHKGGTQ